MDRKHPKVIVTRQLPEKTEAQLTARFGAELREDDSPMSREALARALERADILVPTIADKLDAGILAKAGPNLGLIANYGAGVDHIALPAARAQGLTVTNTPGVLTEDTADMTLALILAVTRRMPEGIALMQSGDWAGWSPRAMLGGRVAGRQLGILGMGRIGQAVARRARAFGLDVHYHNRRKLAPEIEDAVQATYWESLDQMVSRVDILSINCPQTPGTFHLMNARRLKLMKPTAVIVNTSRGEVIDENALTRALRTGEIAGAGLDVYESGLNPRLRALNNVVLLPHMGSATREGRVEMGDKVIANIEAWLKGEPVPDPVLLNQI